MEERRLPTFYYVVDESDPDIAILRRQDGAFVAAFSTGGVTREGIVEAAREDYRGLLRVHWARQAQNTDRTPERSMPSRGLFTNLLEESVFSEVRGVGFSELRLDGVLRSSRRHRRSRAPCV